MLKTLTILAVSVLLAVSATAQPSKGTAENKVAGVAGPQAESQSEKQRRENPPTVVVQVAPQQPDAPETKKKEDADRDLARYTLWLAIFTAVLVVASGVQGIFLYKQANHLRTHAGHLDSLVRASSTSSSVMTSIGEAIQKQADLMNKTLLLQYRPKIIVRNAKVLDCSFDLGKPWMFDVEFQVVNNGGAPAHISADSFIAIASAIGQDGAKVDLRWGDANHLEMFTLEAGQGITLSKSIAAGHNFDLQWENFNQGITVVPFRTILFTGVIFYTDDLNIPRTTGMQRKLDPKWRNFIPNKESEQEYGE